MIIMRGDASLHIQRDKDLSAFNTLALPVRVSHFCEVADLVELRQAVNFGISKGLQIIPLGQGSNVVFSSDLNALVVSINFRGIKKLSQSTLNGYVDVKFSAGENWHQAVIFCLENGWFGLENLSLIPGNMGAAAIQNIGAYGVELSDVLRSVDIFNIETNSTAVLGREECQLSYRNSVFKQSLKDKCIITDITLRLSTTARVNIEYPALSEYFARHKLTLTPSNVSRAVCHLRQAKLPDYRELPNVGSFFKNPVLSISEFDQLKALKKCANMEIPHYRDVKGMIKVPAGWLIDQLGFRGARQGAAGVHENQALVLVNYGQGPKTEWCRDVMSLAKNIRDTVKSEFLIELEIEPRVYGSL